MAMHLYSQCIQRDAEPCRKSFAAVDFFGLFIAIVLGDSLTIFVGETSETSLQAVVVVGPLAFYIGRRQLNERFFIERPAPIEPLQRLCTDQLGDPVDIAGEVIDVLALVNFPRNPIYRFVGVDIRHIRSAPLKVFQQLEPDVLIFFSRLVSIGVERREKTVERGLSENPFAFG